jgi:hypothetical protein
MLIRGTDWLDCLTDLAIEGYGEMLLPSYTSDSGLDWSNHFRTPAGREVVAAVRNEGIFPFTADDAAARIGTNGDLDEDILGSFQPLLYGYSIINAAWSLAKLQVGVPSLDEVVRMLPDALSGARSLLRGQPTPITAVISLTGIRLPEGAQISGAWGRIRPARAEDHPGLLKSMIEKRITTTTESGESVEITDAGDVIFETRIEMVMKINCGPNQMSWSTSVPIRCPGVHRQQMISQD